MRDRRILLVEPERPHRPGARPPGSSDASATQLLRSLTDVPNQVIDRATLLQEAWGLTHSKRRAIDTAIYRLRRRLSEAGVQIETVTGIGYRFAEPPDDQNVQRT